MRTKYEGFKVQAQPGRVFKITKDMPGRMPAELSGAFTSEGDAQKAIQVFQARVRSRAKLSPKQRRARAKREALNGEE